MCVFFDVFFEFFGKLMKAWKHEKDECFERGLDFGENQERFELILDPFLGPFWGPFWALF